MENGGRGRDMAFTYMEIGTAIENSELSVNMEP